MTHKELTIIASKWLRRHSQNIYVPNCSTIITEIVSAAPNGEVPDVIGWNSWTSVLIEVKISRSDFLRDAKKPFMRFNDMWMGEFKYYLCPENLLNFEDVPDDWGLLYCDKKGQIRIEKVAVKGEANIRSERTLLLSLIRRSKIK